jgi:hypothetical protein
MVPIEEIKPAFLAHREEEMWMGRAACGVWQQNRAGRSEVHVQQVERVWLKGVKKSVTDIRGAGASFTTLSP